MAFSGFSTWFHFHDLSMGFRVEIDTRGVKWVKKRGPKRVQNGIFKGWFFRSFFQFWKIQAWILPGFSKTPKNDKKTTQKVSTPSKNRSKMGQKRVIFDPKKFRRSTFLNHAQHVSWTWTQNSENHEKWPKMTLFWPSILILGDFWTLKNTKNVIFTITL